ncbi:ABHD8 protein, partial [Origma solitaria]|nr:ABHD8 protein [Origma solitaria]
STMLTSIADGLLCCLLGKTPNAVGPLDSVESSDGYSFMEVKPGRILRVRHSVPKRPEFPEEPDDGTERGTVHCKRRITLYRNGQLLIENLGDAVRSEIPHEPTVELEVSDPAGIAGSGSAKESGATPPGKRRKRKPKKVITVDCKKRITSCKGTHGDVVLFFIHGVGGSLDIWKEQLEFFSKLGYEVVAPDLAGHGCSSAPPVAAAYTFYALAEDMRAVFKRYAKKRNILIGHSYGNGNGNILIERCKENGNGNIMMGMGISENIQEYPDWAFLWVRRMAMGWDHPGKAPGLLQQGTPGKSHILEGNAFNVSSFVLRAMMSGQYWPEGDEVYHAELAVPVLLVHGMHDKFVPVEEDQRMAEILLIAFLKVIDEGSHMVMLECPDTVNTLLHEFVLWEPDT